MRDAGVASRRAVGLSPLIHQTRWDVVCDRDAGAGAGCCPGCGGIGSPLTPASSAAAGPTTGAVAAGHRARRNRLSPGTPELISECHRLFRYPYESPARI